MPASTLTPAATGSDRQLTTPVNSSRYVELTGVFNREHWRPADRATTGNTWVMGSLEDGTTVSGNADVGDLIPGITYRFYGSWEAGRRLKPGQRQYGNGKRFKFVNFVKSEPHSRFGLVHYLAKFAPGVGPGIAARLFECYGSDACRVLRTDPGRAATEIKGLTYQKAKEAAVALTALAATEDTKIELHNLLANRGFGGRAIDAAIKKWGVLAPVKIKRDPFNLLTAEIAGAGFQRCDRLYMDLGLPPGRTRRQMLCLWDWMRRSQDGHVWFAVDGAGGARDYLAKKISIAEEATEKAIRRGVRQRYLAIRVDEAGKRWVADFELARQEQSIASDLVRLARGHVVLPRFTQAVPGECDRSDDQRHRLSALAVHEEIGFGMQPVAVGDVDGLLRIGRETGICQFCGRQLTNEISRRIGAGPVCAANHGVAYSMEIER